MPPTLTELEREQVAHETRHWVRITYACNNRCVFCLDSDAQHGGRVPTAEVRAEIDRGRALGATRLILSGGEASIHKDFLALIEYGVQAGYGHVQTISNGRMFAYPRFVQRAIDAGLDEVTFSMHGHTAALHDALTGVAGSFDQTTAGIRNAVGSGRLIVSGDVVINRLNVAHLRQVLERFEALGVREYDLLMVVPFGRASPGERGGELLLTPEETLPPLREALAWADRRRVQVWTNRLDPSLLEGHEHLIQDPHKLHDEVRGRAEVLRDLVAGRPMRCAGDRCSFCFLQPLCAAMQEAVAAVREGVPGVLRVDLPAGDDVARHRALLDRPRDALWVRASAAEVAAQVPGAGRARALWLELDDLRGLRRALREAGVEATIRIIPTTAAQLRPAARLAVDELAVTLDRGATPRLARLPHRPGTRRLLQALAVATLREEDARGVSLATAAAGLAADRWIDVPPCLSGAGSVTYEDALPLALLDRAGELIPDPFVDHFIATRYRVKSQRCATCRHDDGCRGISIHQARMGGLQVLTPVTPPRGG